MSGFPISITWSAGSPPVDVFNQLASAATKLDSALAASGANFDKFGQTVQQIESPLSSVGQSMGTLEGSMSGLEGSLGGAAGSMGEFAGSTEQLNGSISETGGFVTEASGSMSELSSTTGETGSAMGELSGTTGEFNGAIGETGGFVTETGTAMGELSTATADTGTAMTDTGTAVTDFGTATLETNTALGESNDALGQIIPSLGDTATGAEDSAAGFETLQPAVEGSNEALDSSSGLLEGVSPLLADTGTNAGDAATGTDTFSGALGGLNTELGPVNGGLTDANTLVGDVGGAADTTAGQTDTLKGSMSGLSFGIAGVVGSAVSLFSSYTAIRNAGARVETAQNNLDKANTKVEKSFNAVGKIITKITTDTENNFKGTTRLAQAYAELGRLIDAGVTSGPKFVAALNNLKAAQDGLTSSTAAGQTQIRTLGTSLDTLGQNARTAELKQNALTKAGDALFQSWAGLAGAGTTLVAALGSITQILSSGGTALATAKVAFAGIGTTITGTLLPALAAIAVPVGVAIAAFVAFTAAVTAIRANIRVFDELGMKVGEVFPEMKGFLDDARQAFINLSDGLNTAISMMLGGIDQLTGGLGDLQAQWDGFTGTLPKGTGELGLAGRALGQLSHQMSATGEQVNIGKGKWTELNGTLIAFGGAVKVASGGWHQLADGTAVYTKAANEGTSVTQEVTTAMDAMGSSIGAVGFVIKEQSANFSELTAAQKFNVAAGNAVIESLSDEAEKRANAVAQAQFYLRTIEGITPAVGLSGAAIVGMSNALRGETQAHFEAVAAAAEYIQGKDATFLTVARTDAAILAYAEKLKEEEKAAGKATDATAKHVQELDKMTQAHTDAAAEISFYTDATNMATRMNAEFQAGVDEATLAIIDEIAALAKLAGQLSVWNDEAKRAQQVVNAFARGMLEQQKAAQQAVLAYAQAVGKLQELEKQMSNTQRTTLAFNQGLVDGKTKALEFQLSLAKTTGEAIAFENGLRDLVVAAGVELPNALGMSAEQMELLLGAMVNAPDAVSKVISAFDELGQKIVETLADAAKEGHDAFMDEIDKMQEELGVEFSEPLIQKLEVEANIENAKQQVQSLLGILATTLRNQPLEIALKTQAAQDALSLLRQKVDEAAMSAPQAFAPLQSALDKLATTDFSGSGITKLPGVLAEIVVASANLEGGMQGAITQFNGLFQSVAQGAGGMQALKSAFAAVDLSLDTTTGKITNAAGVVVAELGKMGPAAGTAATEVDAGLLQMSASGDAARDAWARDMQIMFLAVDQFGKHAQTMAITVSGAFSNMSTNTHASLSSMATGFQIILVAFARLQSDSQRMASTVSGSFSNMANNTRGSMATMASGFQIILAAFTRASSDAQRMNTTVSSAMSQMASRTSSFASSFQSAMNRVGSSAASATSKVKALQSSINALKSKTITITTIIRTVRQTVFAAQGGAFIQSNPGKVGPLSVSEFGQKELVTVTPLQGPGRNAVKGISSLLNEAAEKKRRRTMDEDKEEAPHDRRASTEMKLMRELPIIIHVDGREITRVINRRLFEGGDSLT